jgi:hypothetical protein
VASKTLSSVRRWSSRAAFSFWPMVVVMISEAILWMSRTILGST